MKPQLFGAQDDGVELPGVAKIGVTEILSERTRSIGIDDQLGAKAFIEQVGWNGFDFELWGVIECEGGIFDKCADY